MNIAEISLFIGGQLRRRYDAHMADRQAFRTPDRRVTILWVSNCWRYISVYCSALWQS